MRAPNEAVAAQRNCARNFILMPNNVQRSSACPSSPSGFPAPSQTASPLQRILPPARLFSCCCSFYPTKEKKKKRKTDGLKKKKKWCGLLLRPPWSPAVVSRRPGDGAFDSFFLLLLFFFFFLYAASAAAAFRGILNPNRCPAAAFASESLPSAVGVGSSCCPTQSHGEPTDSPPTNTRLAAPHAERRQPPAPNTPCTHASARTHTEASHCGICSFFWTRFGQRRSGERPHFK